jgi:uncharacterized protein YpmB
MLVKVPREMNVLQTVFVEVNATTLAEAQEQIRLGLYNQVECYEVDSWDEYVYYDEAEIVPEIE